MVGRVFLCACGKSVIVELKIQSGPPSDVGERGMRGRAGEGDGHNKLAVA